VLDLRISAYRKLCLFTRLSWGQSLNYISACTSLQISARRVQRQMVTFKSWDSCSLHRQYNAASLPLPFTLLTAVQSIHNIITRQHEVHGQQQSLPQVESDKSSAVPLMIQWSGSAVPAFRSTDPMNDGRSRVPVRIGYRYRGQL